MSRKKTAEWQPLDTAPKDGTELIFWVSSQKGFQDITAKLSEYLYHLEVHVPDYLHHSINPFLIQKWLRHIFC